MIIRRSICALTMLIATFLVAGCGSGSTQEPRNGAGDISPAAVFSGSGEPSAHAALLDGQQDSGMFVENPESANLVNAYTRVQDLDAVFGPEEFQTDANAEGPVE